MANWIEAPEHAIANAITQAIEEWVRVHIVDKPCLEDIGDIVTRALALVREDYP